MTDTKLRPHYMIWPKHKKEVPLVWEAVSILRWFIIEVSKLHIFIKVIVPHVDTACIILFQEEYLLEVRKLHTSRVVFSCTGNQKRVLFC